MDTSELTPLEQRMANRAGETAPSEDQDTPASSRFSPDAWLAAPENPVVAHRAVLRLTYIITPAIVFMAALARVLGVAVPLWLIIFQGLVMLGVTWRQERMLGWGVFTPWMSAAHLNLVLLMLTVWVAFSGGVQSPFVWIYAIAIAVYGILWGARWALATATLCSLGLLVVLGLSRMGFGVALAGGSSPLMVRVYLVSYIAMFFLVAVVAGVLRRQAGEIFRLAQTDPLTGIANRRALRQALDREVARATRYGNPCAVLVLEIDRFKSINDRFGHLAGDEALRRVAATLGASCRASDLLARFGGDEFVVVMPYTSLDEGRRVGDRIRRDIEEFTLLRGFHLTLSAGLAVYPEDGETSRDLIEAADHAMYRVKQRGGNGI
ncbi:MAG: diguanylate cyclase, partial [bacterium]